MKKSLALLLAAVMTMSLLTACGNSETTKAAGDEETQSGSEIEVEVNTETEADTEAEGTAALADGILTVGTNAEFPPFEYVDDNGEPDR